MTAKAVDPTDPQVLYKLGIAYFKYGDNKRTIKALKHSLKNHPFVTYMPDIYYHCGLAYARLEKFERSLYPFGRAIEMVPSDIRYIHERAKAN